MKCSECEYNRELIKGIHLCNSDKKEQWMIAAPDNELECFNENMYKQIRYEDIQCAILHLKNQIQADLKELDGDTTSEFAQILLRGHKHIEVAIRVLEEKIAKVMLAYTE